MYFADRGAAWHSKNRKHRIRDIFGRDLPRVPRCGLRMRFGVTLRPAKIRIHAARHDCGNSYSFIAIVEHHRFRESVEAELGGVVRGSARESIPAGQRADIDHVALSAPAHNWQEFMAAIVDTREIQSDHVVPLFGTQLRDAFKDPGASVVYKNVCCAKAIHYMCHEAAHRVQI